MRGLLRLSSLAFAAVLATAAQAENIKIGDHRALFRHQCRSRRGAGQGLDLYMKLHAKDIAPHTVS